MELSKQQAEAVGANAGLAPELPVIPEPPTAEGLDKERKRSRLKIGGPELYYRFKNRHSEQSREYHSVPTGTKVAVAAVYLSLAALLIVGVTETYVPRTL